MSTYFPILYSLAGAATGFGATLERAAEGEITLAQAKAAITKRSKDSAASGKFQSGSGGSGGGGRLHGRVLGLF